MSFIKTEDGTTLFYKDWGKGYPLVFVHAWAMSSAFFDHLVIQLNMQGFRCIAYDQRGHGRSDDPGFGYDLETMTNDLDYLLEKLDLHNVTLIGHSMGGAVSLHYQATRSHAGRVSNLVLLATPDYLKLAPGNPEGIDAGLFDQLMAGIAKDFPTWLIANADPFYLPNTFSVSEETTRWTMNMMLQTSMRAVIDCQYFLFNTDFREDARKITIPTLVIHGSKDASIPFRCGVELSKIIPGSIFRAYPGAPHGLIVTHKENLMNDLLSLVNNEAYLAKDPVI